MANVFISHRSSDKTLAERLAADVASAGHKVWIDSAEIGLGDSIVEKIDQGLSGSHYLVLCYSRDGVKSPWISREWQSRLNRQLSGKNVKIIPVIISGGGEIPAILADIKYADFTANWSAALRDLLLALR
jgi:TIR domain